MEKRKDIDMLRFYGGDIHQKNKEAKGLTIRMSNTVQPMLLKILMDALKEPLC
ncbi:Uncharacterised protein [Dorea longicatena]|nr:Uncharacterised protein [Dorea longicatena]